MNFPTADSFSKWRAIALVAFSMLLLGGCEPAEQQTGDMRVLKVPSVYPGRPAHWEKEGHFLLLTRPLRQPRPALVIRSRLPLIFRSILVAFPIRSLSVHQGQSRSIEEASASSRATPTLFCCPTSDCFASPQKTAPNCDSIIVLSTITKSESRQAHCSLVAADIPLMSKVKMPGTSAAFRFQRKSMAISFAFAFESSAVRIFTEIWDNGVYGNQNDEDKLTP